VLDLNRRRFLGGAAALALISPAAAKDKEEYRFRTADVEIEMTIEFHDGYTSQGFWFDELISKRNYCLSAGGEPHRVPFLTVYWKHALASIRVLDLIPGDQTWLQKK